MKEPAFSFSTVKMWVAELKRGQKSLAKDSRPGRPRSAGCDENVNRVHGIIMNYISVTLEPGAGHFHWNRSLLTIPYK